MMIIHLLLFGLLACRAPAIFHLHNLKVAQKAFLLGRNVLRDLLLERRGELRSAKDELFIDHGLLH